MLETTFLILLGIQFAHSIEELTNDFHNKFPPFKMSLKVFLTFEILFLGFWIGVFLLENLKFREVLMHVFAILMFANGLWHIVWASITKKYVPGLVTAPLFVIVFLWFYFTSLM